MKFSLTIHDLTEDQVEGVLKSVRAPTIQELKTTATPVEVELPMTTTPEQVTMIAAASANLIPDATTAPDTVQTDTPELDASGIPWDVRIHSGSKKMTAKGFWKKKRGVDEAEYDAIAAELQDATPVAQPTAPSVPEVPAAPTAPIAAAVPPVPAPAPAPVAPPIAAAVPPARDYEGLMNQINQLFTAGTVDKDYPNTIVARINEGFKTEVPTIVDIGANPEMVDYAWQCMDVDAAARAA